MKDGGKTKAQLAHLRERGAGAEAAVQSPVSTRQVEQAARELNDLSWSLTEIVARYEL